MIEPLFYVYKKLYQYSNFVQNFLFHQVNKQTKDNSFTALLKESLIEEKMVCVLRSTNIDSVFILYVL